MTADPIKDPIPPEFQNIARLAIESAQSIIELVTKDEDLGRAFVGVPHYFHTMIAFACSFLLKTATKYYSHINIDTAIVFDGISGVIELCRSTRCTRYHLVRWIGEGLERLLLTCRRFAGKQKQQHSGQENLTLPHFMTNGPAPAAGGLGNTLGPTDDIGSFWHTAWDTAREASMLYQMDRLTNVDSYPSDLDPSWDMFATGTATANQLPAAQISSDVWVNRNNLRYRDNLEPMGFGLL